VKSFLAAKKRKRRKNPNWGITCSNFLRLLRLFAAISSSLNLIVDKPRYVSAPVRHCVYRIALSQFVPKLLAQESQLAR
jgi:hypothetical protein